MKRSVFLLCMILAAFQTVMAAGRIEVQSAPLPAIIRMGAIKGPSGIGLVHLLENPPALPNGDSIAIELVGSADAIVSKLLSGELDAAVLPVNLAAKLYNSGIDYRLAAIVGNGMVKFITTDASVTAIGDLSRRTVHVAGQASTPEFVLRTILGHHDLVGDAEPTLVFNMPYPEIAASIIAGRIDLVVVPEPFATMILAGNKNAHEPFSLGSLWEETTGLSDYPMTAFVVKADTIKNRAASVRAIMEAYQDSIAMALADPQTAGALVEKFEIGLKAAIAAKAIPQSNYVFQDATTARPMVEGLLRVFLDSAPVSIGGKLPAEGFYADFGQNR